MAKIVKKYIYIYIFEFGVRAVDRGHVFSRMSYTRQVTYHRDAGNVGMRNVNAVFLLTPVSAARDTVATGRTI